MTDPFNVPKRVAVFGATSDIATDLTLQLAERGTTDFLLAARNTDNLRPLTQRLQQLGATATTRPFDAQALEAHSHLVEEMWALGPPVDLVVLAFGVLDDEVAGGGADAIDVARVNYLGAISILELVAHRMTEQGRGSIVVISSVAAERPRASNYVYASTKAGLDAYARGLGDHLAPSGVKVTVVRPGFVHTAMTANLRPGPFPIHPPDVTKAILAGLDKNKAVAWAPRGVRFVMLALRMLPTKLYRRISRNR